jgi:hypothetical protein
MFQLFLKDPELEAVIKRLVGRPVRITLKVGEAALASSGAPGAAHGVSTGISPVGAPGTQDASRRPSAVDPEAAARALEHPEVKRFQELFPDSEVRAIRNLKEI